MKKKIVTLTAILSFSWCVAALGESRIEGVWVEDKSKNIYGEKTSYLANNCLNPKLAFIEGVVAIWQKLESCSANGEKAISTPYFYVFEYEVVEDLNKVLVLKIKDKKNNSEKLSIYYFVNDNSFWKYYYGESNDQKYHIRAYYKKLVDEDDINKALKEIDNI